MLRWVRFDLPPGHLCVEQQGPYQDVAAHVTKCAETCFDVQKCAEMCKHVLRCAKVCYYVQTSGAIGSIGPFLPLTSRSAMLDDVITGRPCSMTLYPSEEEVEEEEDSHLFRRI